MDLVEHQFILLLVKRVKGISMFRLICILIGYAIGCIQTAYFVGKIFGNIDIREHGSGNAGFTNMTRVLGRKAGIITFLGDILKTVVAILICTGLFKGTGTFLSYDNATIGVLAGLYAGLGVIIGHNWPFYLKFIGGKGIAATLALILCLDVRVAAITFGAGIIVVAITRYISAASLMITLLFPIVMFYFGYPMEVVFICMLVTISAYYKHRGNMERLIKGTERKFSFSKKG